MSNFHDWAHSAHRLANRLGHHGILSEDPMRPGHKMIHTDDGKIISVFNPSDKDLDLDLLKNFKDMLKESIYQNFNPRRVLKESSSPFVLGEYHHGGSRELTPQTLEKANSALKESPDHRWHKDLFTKENPKILILPLKVRGSPPPPHIHDIFEDNGLKEVNWMKGTGKDKYNREVKLGRFLSHDKSLMHEFNHRGGIFSEDDHAIMISADHRHVFNPNPPTHSYGGMKSCLTNAGEHPAFEDVDGVNALYNKVHVEKGTLFAGIVNKKTGKISSRVLAHPFECEITGKKANLMDRSVNVYGADTSSTDFVPQVANHLGHSFVGDSWASIK